MLNEIDPPTSVKRKQSKGAHKQPYHRQHAMKARGNVTSAFYSPAASPGASFFLIGSTSLTVMAAKIRTKPKRSLKVTCSPVMSTENSTPKTDSRLSSSEACAGGTWASARF